MIDMNKIGRVADDARWGVALTPLFEDQREAVQLETWQPGARAEFDTADGAELLVLSGSLVESGDTLSAMSWLWLPRGGCLSAQAGGQRARVWVKRRRHLRFIDAPEMAWENRAGEAPRSWHHGAHVRQTQRTRSPGT